MAQQAAPVTPSPRHDPLAGCLTNIVWMMVGPGVLGLSAMSVLVSRDPALRLIDAIYWVLVAAMLTARYLEVRWFQRVTEGSAPQTMRDFRRYAVLLAVMALTAWCTAHGVAYLTRR
jgi:hypothetical protein